VTVCAYKYRLKQLELYADCLYCLLATHTTKMYHVLFIVVCFEYCRLLVHFLLILSLKQTPVSTS